MPIIHNKARDNFSIVSNGMPMHLKSSWAKRRNIKYFTPEEALQIHPWNLECWKIKPGGMGVRISGVYFLFRGEEIVYVGMSRSIYPRVKRHMGDKVFDYFTFIPILGNPSRVEDFFIRELRPIYNSGAWCDTNEKVGGIIKKMLLQNGLTRAELVDGKVVLT